MRLISYRILLLLFLSGCLQPAAEPNADETPLPPAPPKPPSKEEQSKITLEPALLWSYTAGDNVYGVALSADAEYIALGSWDERMYLLNKKGELLWEFKPGGGVHDVAMTQDGEWIAFLSYTYDTTTVHLFDKDGMELWNASIPALARGVDVSNEGSVAVASSSGKIYLLNEGSVLWEYVLEKSTWGAWDVVIADKRIIAGDDNADVYELSLGGELLRKTKLAAKDYIYGVAADSNGSYIVGVTQNKNVYLLKDGKQNWRRQTGFSNYGAAISPQGLVAVGSWDANLYIYDIKGNLLWKHNLGDNVNRLAFSGNGKYLLAASSDKRVYLFEI